jgi:hypothetical protein
MSTGGDALRNKASPLVLSLSLHIKIKLDEEKSKYAGLARENGFAPANLLTLLMPGIAKLCACYRRV